MRTPRPIVLQGLLAWLAMLLLPPALSAQDAPPQNQQYAQVKLFSIPYGSEPDQLGLSSAPVETGERAGPGHIQVDGHGNIWLLDACHAQVKAFSRDGKLLRTVGKAEPGELDEYGNPVNPLARVNYIAQYAVDDRGYVYLWCDLNYMRLLVVDPSGRVVTSDVDGYGWLIEPRGEEKLRLQMTEAGLEGLLDPVPFDGFQTDRAGNLYMLVGIPREQWTDWHKRKLHKFSPTHDYLGSVSGEHVGPDGFTYEFAPEGTRTERDLYVYDANGEQTGTVHLVAPEGLEALGRADVFDRSHNIYLYSDRERDEPEMIEPPPEITRAGLKIWADYVVCKYSLAGDLLAQFRVPYPPVQTGWVAPPIAVDSDENVHYLEFTPTGVDVMMWQKQAAE